MVIGPLWATVASAGEPTEILETNDIQITSVALETAKSGRTVVKIHFVQEDLDDEDDSEDDEEDSENDELMRTPKGQDVTVVLTSLYAEQIESATVNLTLPGDTPYEIIVEGPNSVHLMGNFISQDLPSPYDDYPYSDSEIDSDLEGEEGGLYDPETGLPMEYDEDDSDLDDDDDEDIEDLDEDEIKARFAEIVDGASPGKGKLNGKASMEVDDEEEDDSEEFDESLLAPTAVKSAPAAAAAPASADGLSKNQRKKLAKQAKQAAAGKGDVQAVSGKKEEKTTISKDGKKVDEVKTSAEVTVSGADGKDVKATAKKASKKTTLPNGVIVEDMKTGDGAAAKAGQRVSMRYIGKLKDGKVFDSNTKGKPFAFKLGKGEVIKGWDTGIEGMRPGGERRLTIPPSQAYGKQGTDGIPANAVLTFDVKLLAIN